ncbi:short-chain dehydrogenase [Kiloniella litopenaei]|uniref:Short-chain dehydrogenase n=1 Tax=Kiloniella litopenaei TaxID=1549748 RepID=A0A0M2RFB5_9PROT|nr:SDR family oxidoreductase [Kiloniella litopenaei]KKJ78695.1 short-chain dehydrogenase [Kiloniella litopenaei]
MSNIKGKVAFVTGANRGIGRAFVEELIAAGASKVYAAARDANKLSDLVQENEGKVIPVTLDVNQAETIKTLANDFKDVALLINNAGIARFTSFMTAPSLDDARDEMETNYFAPLNMIRAFAPVLKENNGGAIVNISSVAGYLNFPVLGSYSASKAAVHSLTQGVRAELAGQGTHVVGVYPGPIDTDMTASVPLDKTAPNIVAKEVLNAVENGIEDVYPDPMSVDFHAGFLSDPKALEKQVGEMLPE